MRMTAQFLTEHDWGLFTRWWERRLKAPRAGHMCEQKQPARTAALQTSSLTKQPGWEPELRNVNIEIPGSFFFSFLPSRQKKKKKCVDFFLASGK